MITFNTNLIKELKNIFLLTFGAVLLSVGITFFLLPAEIATGGTPGMAMLLHFATGLSTGKAMLVFNIPLLLIGSKFIDLHFALRSVYAMLLIAALVEFLPGKFDFPIINSMMLSTMYGGAIIGAGVGLVLKGNGSSGGTIIIAKIVSHYTNIRPAKTLLIMDVIIITAISYIFLDMERALWSIFSIYLTTQVIDRILTGVISEKIVHIISNDAEQIGQKINTNLEREGSIISARNLTLQEDRKLLFVVVSSRRIPQLRALVLDVDPDALMIVMEASEMTGASRYS